MSKTDLNRSDRAADIMEDISNYIAELVADGYHDRWEQWTVKIDTVCEELRELYDIIAELESASKKRMLNNIEKTLLTAVAHGDLKPLRPEAAPSGSRWPLTAT